MTCKMEYEAGASYQWRQARKLWGGELDQRSDDFVVKNLAVTGERFCVSPAGMQ